MKNERELKGLCTLCGSPISTRKDTDLYTTDIGSTYARHLRDCKQHTFGLSICMSCKVESIVTSGDIDVLSFSNSLVRYREPDHHFERVVGLLKSHVNARFERIVKYSVKDDSLGVYIEDHSDLLSGGHGSCKRLHLLRRFVEHINSYRYLRELLSDIDIGDLVLIELPDFLKIKESGSVDFVWDERVLYPSPNIIQRALGQYGLVMRGSLSEDYPRPFKCLLFERYGSDVVDYSSESDDSIDLPECIRVIRSNIAKRLDGSASVSFIGLNNYSLFCASMARSVLPDIEIALYDDSDIKVGTYWNGLRVKSTTEFTSCDKNIFSFEIDTQSDSNKDRFGNGFSPDKMDYIGSYYQIRDESRE